MPLPVPGLSLESRTPAGPTVAAGSEYARVLATSDRCGLLGLRGELGDHAGVLGRFELFDELAALGA